MKESENIVAQKKVKKLKSGLSIWLVRFFFVPLHSIIK